MIFCRPRVLCVTLGLLSITGAMTGCGKPPRPTTPVAGLPDTGQKGDSPPIVDWPCWRGQNQDGVAPGTYPTQWSAAENVAWKAAIPGRGHSSPIIVGDRIYLETADDKDQVQSVLCLKRTDGSQVWQTEIHRGNFESRMHGENTQASSTLACDGSRLYAVFLNDRKIWVSAIDLEGHILWQKPMGEFASKFGYSASPVIYENLIILSADHSGGGFLVAVQRETGDLVWRKPRDKGDSYASPRVVMLGGKPQVILGGTRKVVSYDPLTGNENWSAKGTAEAVVGTAVVADDLVFVTGGYPEAETLAIKPDGSVAWRKNVKSYVPSLVAYSGHVFLANDDGVVICWEAASGKEKWKHRVGGNFRVSPLLAGGNIYITDMSAKTTVFKASAEGFESVAENQLGTEAFASPAASRGQLFLRVADSSAGSRQEFLYSIGTNDSKVTFISESLPAQLEQRLPTGTDELSDF